MKCCFIFLLFLSTTSKAQEWFAEVMVGVSAYNGDLTEKDISATRLRPGVNFNMKYITGDFINLRAGILYSKLTADDNKNSDPGLKSRNLNFKTDIIELDFCAEVNIFDPHLYYSYPYIFGGIGIFHFNPYTYDKDNKKTYLQPLGTEGQGLNEFPGRKKYSLTQVCFPVGAGYKIRFKKTWELSYEFGYRILVTDYLDDVSKTYVNLKALEAKRGSTAVELSYRKQEPFREEGEKRGNSLRRDSYFFSGLKLATRLGKSSKQPLKSTAVRPELPHK